MADQIEYIVRAILDTQKRNDPGAHMLKTAQNAQRAATAIGMVGSRVTSVGNGISAMGRTVAGTGFQTAQALGHAAVAAAALGGAYGMGRAVIGAVAFNRELENTQMTIGTTLQLFDHNAAAMGSMTDMATQFNANLDTGAETMERLIDIAAKSPASFGQAKTMFANMLPGARSVTDNMEEILDLTKKSLSLGLVMGGDFQTTGAQLSRILTGGAGAEFETWKILQKPILDAGKAAGYFNKQQEMGATLTEKFNKLDPARRLFLVQEATKRLGVATEALGKTWDGITSTIGSNIQLMQKELGAVTFTRLKRELGELVEPGGLFMPGSRVHTELDLAARFFGMRLGDAAGFALDKAVSGLVFVAENWRSIVTKLTLAFDKGAHVAGLFLKVAAARAITGAGMQVAGGAISAGGGMLSSFGSIAGTMAQAGMSLGQIATVSAAALPGLLLLGAAITGVGVAFAGVAAFFVEHWDEIARAFANGQLTLQPLLLAIDLLWAKLVAVGEAFLGTTDPVEGTRAAIDMLVRGLAGLSLVMEIALSVAGALGISMHMIYSAMALVYSAVIALGSGLAFLVETTLDLVSKIPGSSALGIPQARDEVKQLRENVNSHLKDVGSFIGGTFESDFVKAAQASRNARLSLEKEGITQGIRDALADERKFTSKDIMRPSGFGRGQGDSKSNRPPPPPTTNIYGGVKVVMNNRTNDPDRLIGAFARRLNSLGQRPTQASTLPVGGS